MKRFLVLAPHPDDEVVGCAIAIRRAVAAGDTPHLLFLTTGVPVAAALWPWQRAGHGARIAARRAEAMAVAERLSATVLGFQPWPSRTLKDHIGEALAIVGALIERHGIDALWVPAWEGAHQDHDVANFIGAQLSGRCPVIEFAEYNFAGGRVRSGEFARPDGGERVIDGTEDERRWKRALLDAYRSERGNLAHCGDARESLRPLARYDYARAPHDGRLFRERFHWVPFRHPRIDFDRSADILAALRRATVRE